jgi:cyclopropane fatty-acyl-phospholipid synthase-like methyltransferase
VQGPLWEAEADTWSQIQEPQHKPLFAAMLDAAEVGPGSRLLDVGCGGGCSSALALERGASVTGLDAAFYQERASEADRRDPPRPGYDRE